MAGEDTGVTTGIDGLIKLVHGRKRIEMSEAAHLIGVSTGVAEEWARSLEEEGLLRVDYQLTRMYLVWKDVSGDEVSTKVAKIQQQKSALSQDVASLIERARTRGAEMDEIMADMEKLTSVMDGNLPANLRRRLDALHAVDKDKEKTFQEKMRGLDEVKSRLDTIERDITGKRELLESLKMRAKEVEETPDLRQRVGEITEARKQLDNTMHNIADMKLSLEDTVRKSAEQKKVIDGALGAMDKLEGKMDEMLKTKKEVQALIENLDTQVKVIDRSLVQMREMLVSGEISENAKRLGRERERIESLEREINAQNGVLAERTDAIRDALQSHETKYEEMMKAKNRLAASMEDYDVELARIDSSFRNEAKQMRALADEMSSILNANKQDIEKQLELARAGLEKYEVALTKRDKLMDVKESIEEMEVERDGS